MSKKFFHGSGQYQAPYPPNSGQGGGYGGQQGYGQPPYGAPYEEPQRGPGAAKSSFWTFCFAFVPGAGQMYLGYMKRGLSLIGLFCVSFFLTDLIYALAVFMPVVWMYSFFDTFNLRGQLLTGRAPEDDFLLHLGHNARLEQLLAKRHTLVGWVLIALGVWAILTNFVMGPLQLLCEQLGIYWLYSMIHNLPALLVMVAMIAVGIWLVRGPQGARYAPDDEDFSHYAPGPSAGPAAAPSPAQPENVEADSAPAPEPGRDLFSDIAPTSPTEE